MSYKRYIIWTDEYKFLKIWRGRRRDNEAKSTSQSAFLHEIFKVDHLENNKNEYIQPGKKNYLEFLWSNQLT